MLCLQVKPGARDELADKMHLTYLYNLGRHRPGVMLCLQTEALAHGDYVVIRRSGVRGGAPMFLVAAEGVIRISLDDRDCRVERSAPFADVPGGPTVSVYFPAPFKGGRIDIRRADGSAYTIHARGKGERFGFDVGADCLVRRSDARSEPRKGVAS